MALVHWSIFGAPTQPQYALFRQLFGSNVNLSHPISSVFELPDELILYILSFVSPDPRLAGHHARYRCQFGMGASDYHEQRMRFLLPLSMTCMAMRLRLLPWMWERLENHKLIPTHRTEWRRTRKLDLNVIVKALRTDAFLAANVKYFSAFFVVVPELNRVFSGSWRCVSCGVTPALFSSNA